MLKVFGVAIMVLALVVAVLPGFLTCQHAGKSLTLVNGKTVAMKCNWTAKAELAVGVPLAGVGLTMAFSRRRESIRNLALLGAIMGIFVILLPTNLIGVCQSNAMLCNSVMKPSLLAIGSIVVVTSLAGLVLSQRVKEKG